MAGEIDPCGCGNLLGGVDEEREACFPDFYLVRFYAVIVHQDLQRARCSSWEQYPAET
jgi:hypothetical protein